jgi:transposase InsO family protein
MTGMSRQNFYQQRRQRQARAVDEELVLTLVRRERQQQPRLGTRKLLWMLGPELSDAGVGLGRDQMFDLLRRHDLLLERLRGTPRTTQSRHPLPVFHNLVRDLVESGPDQAWVADITYVRTEAGFVYVALIMDRYSRKIVGWHCGENLESFGCVEALKMALKDLPVGSHPVHHSDRGCQYCCHPYVELLQDRGLPISMTEQNHCYENAHAERVNGILKQEYALGTTFRTKADARRAVEQAVWLYNHRRPHLSLGFRTPAQVHSLAA